MLSINKIIRTICYFTESLSNFSFQRLGALSQKLKDLNFEIQTTRICTKNDSIQTLSNILKGQTAIACIGSVTYESLASQLTAFSSSPNVFANIDLTLSIDEKDIQLLFIMIRKYPELTFRFTYVFNNLP